MKHKTALIIDDDPLFQIVMEEALLSAGLLTVQTADDGRLGVGCVNDNPGKFDLIICDLQMPNMTGVDVVRELSNLGFSGSVVIVSSEDDGLIRTVHNMARMLGVCVAGALSKPLNIVDLHDILKQQVYATDRQTVATFSRTQIKKALTEHRLRPFFQPKIDVRTKMVSGFEVLARLDTADKNASAPSAFLAAAEKHGLMTEVTLVMIERAFSEVVRWRGQMDPFKLAFNLSPTSVQDTNLPQVLLELARDHGIESNAITLEITEDRLLENKASTLEVLSSLRLAGFELSIDDFGTGATSIEQLRMFPFSELKIDRQFVQATSHDEFSRTTVQTCAKFAAILGMRVVAEGVEADEALKFVRSVGVQEVQGFLFSKALPPKEVLDWMKAYQMAISLAA